VSRTLDYAEPLASEPWKAAYARALLAGEQGRLDDATAELAEALRLVPTDLPASDRAHLLYLFGVVHLVNGRAAQAVMNFTNAEAIPGALAGEDHLWLLCRLAWAKCELGAMASAAEVLGRLTAAAGDTAEPVLRFEILQLRAILATWNSTDLVTAESALREAISLADTTPLDPGLRARARTDLAAFLLVMQRAACEITPLCWQALGFVEEDGEPDDPEVARVHVLLASAALADGRPDDARRHAEWGLSIAECVLPTWNTTFVEAVTTLAQALDALGLEEAARRQRAAWGADGSTTGTTSRGTRGRLR
jgi:tetratricopeptide (TPR) repeat protein